VLQAGERMIGEGRTIVFTCQAGPGAAELADDNVTVIPLRCVGHLPPSFIDFIISRRHADGVFLTGCRAGDCFDRLGHRWTEQRLAGARDPQLRKRVPRERLAWFWAGNDHAARLRQQVRAFSQRLQELGPYERASAAVPRSGEASQEREAT